MAHAGVAMLKHIGLLVLLKLLLTFSTELQNESTTFEIANGILYHSETNKETPPPGDVFISDNSLRGLLCTINTYAPAPDATACSECVPGTYSNHGSSVCKPPIVCTSGKRLNPLHDVVSGHYSASCPPGSYVCGINYQNYYAYFFYCCKLGGEQVGHWRISTFYFNNGMGGEGAIYTSTNDGYPPLPFNPRGTFNTFQNGISRVKWTYGGAEIYSNGELLYKFGNFWGEIFDVSCEPGKIATGFYGFYGEGWYSEHTDLSHYGPNLDRASPMCNTMCMTCATCEAGKYIQTECTDSSDTSCAACSTCEAGKYIETACTASSDASCINCLHGSYSSATASTACTPCSAGSYSTLPGATSISDCILCPSGGYSVLIGASSSSSCIACSHGKYSSSIGSTTMAACISCSADKCLVPGQYSTCGNSTPGSGCNSCQNTLLNTNTYYPPPETTKFTAMCLTRASSAGTYRTCTNPRAPMKIMFMKFISNVLDFGSSCLFQDNRNNQPYYRCNNGMHVWWEGINWMGSYSLGNTSNAKNGPTVDGNSYLSGGHEPMTALYSNLRDISVVWEISCPPGSYAPATGSTACTLASSGFYVSLFGESAQQQCNTDFYSYIGASECSASCPAGTTKATTVSQCIPTPPGSYSTSGTSTPCPTGTYSTASGASVCTGCTAGAYNSVTGASSVAGCLLCSQGTYASTTGFAACENCNPGTYSTTTGITVCTSCTATSCPIGQQIQTPCTPTSNIKCGACTPVANCFHVPGTACGNATNPNCLCPPGFELVGNRCQPCKAGFFRSANSSRPCAAWNTATTCAAGHFLSNGTRFADTVCIPCPAPPSNGTPRSAGCQWGCSAGYNRTF